MVGAMKKRAPIAIRIVTERSPSKYRWYLGEPYKLYYYPGRPWRYGAGCRTFRTKKAALAHWRSRMNDDGFLDHQTRSRAR
jgi:hypothetical protein